MVDVVVLDVVNSSVVVVEGVVVVVDVVDVVVVDVVDVVDVVVEDVVLVKSKTRGGIVGLRLNVGRDG